MQDLTLDVFSISSGKNRSAIRLAEKAHRGQMRKGGDDVPYITHPIAVYATAVAAGASRNVACACLLHDVVEDSDITIDDIAQEFGFTVASLVKAVTKSRAEKDLPLDQQAVAVYRRLHGASTEAMVVKGSDLVANMSDIVWDCEKYGLEHVQQLYGPERAGAKIDHYLELSALIADNLAQTRYNGLAEALRIRSAELLEFRKQLQGLT